MITASRADISCLNGLWQGESNSLNGDVTIWKNAELFWCFDEEEEDSGVVSGHGISELYLFLLYLLYFLSFPCYLSLSFFKCKLENDFS